MNRNRILFFGSLLLLAALAPLLYKLAGYSDPNLEGVYEEVFLTDSIGSGRAGTYVTKQRPKNVIFLIGDGMGLSQVSAGAIAKKDGLNLEQFRHIGLIKTYSTKLITDSAAGATAMATGTKTYNSAISVNTDQDSLKTILEYAEEADMSTGIISTATVTHATPACFYGHVPRRGANQTLAAQLMTKNVEVIMGGGRDYFDPLKRDDKRDLLAEARKQKYFIVEDVNLLESMTLEKVMCLISPGSPPGVSKRDSFLEKAIRVATKTLSQNPKGFFMMAESAQIDWGGHANNSTYIVEEMLDFDRAIGAALDFARKDRETLIIITADHETGGYAIIDGDLKQGKVKGGFSTGYHTATMVPVYAYGPGAESFTGIYDNTEIFHKLKYLMGLSDGHKTK